METFSMVRMGASCPRCGYELKEVNRGHPMEGGTAVNSIVRCTGGNCQMEWAIHVRMMPMGVFSDDGQLHGVAKAVRMHEENGEKMCPDCNAYLLRCVQDRKARALVNA